MSRISSADLIRHGSDSAAIEGLFSAACSPELITILDESGIDAHDGIALDRIGESYFFLSDPASLGIV